MSHVDARFQLVSNDTHVPLTVVITHEWGKKSTVSCLFLPGSLLHEPSSASMSPQFLPTNLIIPLDSVSSLCPRPFVDSTSFRPKQHARTFQEFLILSCLFQSQATNAPNGVKNNRHINRRNLRKVADLSMLTEPTVARCGGSSCYRREL